MAVEDTANRAGDAGEGAEGIAEAEVEGIGLHIADRSKADGVIDGLSAAHVIFMLLRIIALAGEGEVVAPHGHEGLCEVISLVVGLGDGDRARAHEYIKVSRVGHGRVGGDPCELAALHAERGVGGVTVGTGGQQLVGALAQLVGVPRAFAAFLASEDDLGIVGGRHLHTSHQPGDVLQLQIDAHQVAVGDDERGVQLEAVMHGLCPQVTLARREKEVADRCLARGLSVDEQLRPGGITVDIDMTATADAQRHAIGGTTLGGACGQIIVLAAAVAGMPDGEARHVARHIDPELAHLLHNLAVAVARLEDEAALSGLYLDEGHGCLAVRGVCLAGARQDGILVRGLDEGLHAQALCVRDCARQE